MSLAPKFGIREDTVPVIWIGHSFIPGSQFVVVFSVAFPSSGDLDSSLGGLELEMRTRIPLGTAHSPEQ